MITTWITFMSVPCTNELEHQCTWMSWVNVLDPVWCDTTSCARVSAHVVQPRRGLCCVSVFTSVVVNLTAWQLRMLSQLPQWSARCTRQLSGTGPFDLAACVCAHPCVALRQRPRPRPGSQHPAPQPRRTGDPAHGFQQRAAERALWPEGAPM